METFLENEGKRRIVVTETAGILEGEYHQLILTVLFMAGLLLPGLYAASFRNFIIINDLKVNL